MHHKSPFSQDAYTSRDAVETARYLLRIRSANGTPFAELSIDMPTMAARGSVLPRLRPIARRAA